MQTKSRLLASILTLTLVACVTATPYQPARNGEGYSEQKIESNRYRVTFSGNASTPRQTVESYLLYRAAEVTMANGYDYFVLADQTTETQTSYTQTFSGFDDFGWYSWHPRFGVGATVGTSTPRTEYEGQVNIVMFKGRKPNTEVKAFDAREVKANLEPQIVRADAKR
jgi:hypothetical protein